MAKTDAWYAPGGRFFFWRKRRRKAAEMLAGNAKIIAAPAYRRLLAAEPYLRRSIPTLIVIFLIVVAASRFMSLLAWREDVERSARTILGLASGELVNAISMTARDGEPDLSQAQLLIEAAARRGGLGRNHVLVVTDADFSVVAPLLQLCL